MSKGNEPDIFAPHIVFTEMAGAGMYKIHGGTSGVNKLTFDAGLGSPVKPALVSAFSLALSAQIPLWLQTGLSYRLLYHPDPEILLSGGRS